MLIHTTSEEPEMTIRPTFRPASDVPFEALRLVTGGEVIVPGDAGYEDARRLQNFTFDRRPAAIVRAASTDDVVEAVRFARQYNVAVAVRSGGHSVAGQSVADGALVIDLSAMRAVTIDSRRRRAIVQPGATSGDLAGPAHAYGLALSTGDTASVGIGGLTLGGGIGYMVRKYGLAIDNLLSAKLVTADARVVSASPAENRDLFWAIRGGGGNFGVVTELEFQLAPVGAVLGGVLVLPATREVVRGYLEYAVQAPDELTTIAEISHIPPAPFIPEDRVGELAFAVFVCYAGDPEEGERAIAPLRALAEPIAGFVDQMPYPGMFEFSEPATHPHGGAIRSGFADSFSDAEIDAAIEFGRVATSPFGMVHFRALGGAMARLPADATAFAHRERRYLVAAISLWLDPAEDPAPHRRWMEGLWERLRPATSGVYSNFLEDEGHGRVLEAYPAGAYARLAEVKRRYDPENFFRFNQNIKPAG
jgi:FAD/FMN-containing dehydrogenase